MKLLLVEPEEVLLVEKEEGELECRNHRRRQILAWS